MGLCVPRHATRALVLGLLGVGTIRHTAATHLVMVVGGLNPTKLAG